MADYFGFQIPDDVMEDVLFRFLYNIPENEKSDYIRVCFHLEQAHWFYIDIYCATQGTTIIVNKKISFTQFARQVFFKCDYLHKWRLSVDTIVEEFRHYKSNVPTYGVILLDSTLNYVLLVQGFYATKNSWGFPKGKVNEGEIPLQCAIRETEEEVGFDATDYICKNNIAPFKHIINETFVGLYIAVNVPLDYSFKPHVRNEIRKISWFSVADLPKDKTDVSGCMRLGLNPQNFYTVLPFVNDIMGFIGKERYNRTSLKATVLKTKSSSRSAFEPVKPRGNSILLPGHYEAGTGIGIENVLETDQLLPQTSINERLFKPLKTNMSNLPTSFTGQSFLDHIVGVKKTSSTDIDDVQKVVGAGEIKQPKPVHSTQLVINVYESPSYTEAPIPNISNFQQQKQVLQTVTQSAPNNPGILEKKSTNPKVEDRVETKKTEERELSKKNEAGISFKSPKTNESDSSQLKVTQGIPEFDENSLLHKLFEDLPTTSSTYIEQTVQMDLVPQHDEMFKRGAEKNQLLRNKIVAYQKAQLRHANKPNSSRALHLDSSEKCKDEASSINKGKETSEVGNICSNDLLARNKIIAHKRAQTRHEKKKNYEEAQPKSYYQQPISALFRNAPNSIDAFHNFSVQPSQQRTVKLCDAWKKFSIDLSRIPTAALYSTISK